MADWLRALSRHVTGQAAHDLAEQGVPVTDVNIAEQAAVQGYEDKPATPPGAAAQDLGVGGPHSDIAAEVQKRIDARRREGPSPEMVQRFRQKYGGR